MSMLQWTKEDEEKERQDVNKLIVEAWKNATYDYADLERRICAYLGVDWSTPSVGHQQDLYGQRSVYPHIEVWQSRRSGKGHVLELFGELSVIGRIPPALAARIPARAGIEAIGTAKDATPKPEPATIAATVPIFRIHKRYESELCKSSRTGRIGQHCSGCYAIY